MERHSVEPRADKRAVKWGLLRAVCLACQWAAPRVVPMVVSTADLTDARMAANWVASLVV